jgi:hypothetical protein
VKNAKIGHKQTGLWNEEPDAFRICTPTDPLTGILLLIQRVFSHSRPGQRSVTAMMISYHQKIMIDKDNIVSHVNLAEFMLDVSMHE